VLTAGNLIGTISNTVMGNSTVHIGTTAIALNRTSAIQSLSGVSIDGSAGSVAASAITGTTLPTAIVNSNLQSVGTLSALAVSGNVNASTFVGNVTGNTIGIHTGAVVGNVTGNVTGSALTVTQAAQSAITSLGTLTGLTVSGTIAASVNNTINIGAAGTTFATVFATTFSGVSTTAKYADLAENYLSDSEYEAGTVVVFGGDKEITTTQLFADTAVAGVISTNPAYLMNDALDGQPVALRGRVPVKVQGSVKKGDLLVTSNTPGVAMSVSRSTNYGAAIFAKALENKTTAEIGVIEAVII
jgi:hypothetical protein